MEAQTYTANLAGIRASRATVTAAVGGAIPTFSLVGVPPGATGEIRTRVQTAVRVSGFRWPAEAVRVTVAGAAPTAALDLPIAAALLVAIGAAAPAPDAWLVGELGLDGRVRTVRGVLPIALAAAAAGARRLVVPTENADEAAAAGGDLDVIAIDHLAELPELLANGRPWGPYRAPLDDGRHLVDMADIRGQIEARRALERAAVNRHHLLMVGPPGCGRTMLARRLPTILPPMTSAEQLEVSAVHSVAGLTRSDAPLLTRRPFRAPHHTVGDAAMFGGGIGQRPGEISLAHGGVLYLDELPEFRRSVLEGVAAQLQRDEVTLAGPAGEVCYPARVQLVASMSPCPCGYRGHPRHVCECEDSRVRSYERRIDALRPLFGEVVEVVPATAQEVRGAPAGESSAAVRSRLLPDICTRWPAI